jgi:type II secretory pathway pseudopilin PulG
VELLVVVIIIAVLAGLSAGAVIRYGNKARVSAAKAVVASAARECLRWMVDSEEADFALGTSAGEGFRLLPDPPECGGPQVVSFVVTIDVMPGSTFGVNVNPDGTLERVCTGSVDCQGGRW